MDALLRKLLADAFADALRRPEVVAALRGAFANDIEPEADPDRLLTKAELAKRLAVSVSTVDRLTRSGMPVAAIVGDHRRYRIAEVEAWLAERGTVQ